MHRLVLLLVVAAVLAGCDSGSGESSSGSSASTSASSSTATTAGGETDEVAWPLFGRVEQRTHYIADAPDPPFHMLWQFFAKQLIEFPPIVEDGLVLVINKTGDLFVIDADTGRPFARSTSTTTSPVPRTPTGSSSPLSWTAR